MIEKEKFNQGVKLLKDGNFEEALKIFNRLIEKHSLEADFWSERGVVYFHLGQKEKSLSDMDKAVELQPLKSYRYSSRAYILGHYKQTDRAIKDYERAIELDPEDAVAMNNLGLLQEQLGYQTQAKQNYSKADEIGLTRGRNDQGIQGEDIRPRNLQKELEQQEKERSIITELKSLKTKEGRASFFRFLFSGFKKT